MVSVVKFSELIGLVWRSEEARGAASTAKTAADTLERTPGKARPQGLPPAPVVSTVGVAASPNRVASAWQLVHNEYVRAGILDGHRPGGLHAPRTLLESAPFVLTSTQAGRVDATLSVMPGARLPADSVPEFHTLIEGMRARGESVIELGMFARDSSAPRQGLQGVSLRSHSGPNAMRNLFAMAFAICKHEGATRAVITVHPSHAPYYVKLFNFAQVGSEAAHPTVDGARAVLLTVDLAAFRAARGGEVLETQTLNVLRNLPSESERRSLMREIAH